MHQRNRSSDEMLVHAEITDFVKGLSDTASEWVSKLETNLLKNSSNPDWNPIINPDLPIQKHCKASWRVSSNNTS